MGADRLGLGGNGRAAFHPESRRSVFRRISGPGTIRTATGGGKTTFAMIPKWFAVVSRPCYAMAKHGADDEQQSGGIANDR